MAKSREETTNINVLQPECRGGTASSITMMAGQEALGLEQTTHRKADPGNASALPKEVVSGTDGLCTGGRGRIRKAGEESTPLPPVPQSQGGISAVKSNVVIYIFTASGASQGFRVILLLERQWL